MTFVGRTFELELLRGLLVHVGQGQGASAWVEGEPGIGKSALIAEALTEAAWRGCQVQIAVANEQSPIFPLRVLLDGLGVEGSDSYAEARQLGAVENERAAIVNLLGSDGQGTVTPLDAVAAAAERLVGLVHRLCAEAPTVLVVDDAQWVDSASFWVLRRLTRLLRQLPLLLVVAARPVPARTEVEALRHAMSEGGAAVIDLGPLDGSEAAEMARRLLDAQPGPVLAAQLATAGGNPMYLRELIDALIQESRLSLDGGSVELISSTELPATIPAAVGRRLRFLTPRAMTALRTAAVLGPTFSVADLCIVTGQRATDLVDVIEEAVDAGIVTESPSTVHLSFRHGLVHQTLYEGMPLSLRAALHGQAAEKLAQSGAPVEHVAPHLLGAPATLDSWARAWLLDAAPMLTNRAPAVAVDLLQRARDSLRWEDPDRERIDVELAMAALTLGENERVDKLARPVFDEARDPSIVGRVAWILAYALSRLGRLGDAIALTREALNRDGLSSTWRARLRARQAMSLWAAGQYDQARVEAEQAEAEGRAAGDKVAMAYALHTLAYVEFYNRRQTGTAKAAVDRALAVLRDEPQATDLLLLLLVNLGGALGALGQTAQADATFAQAVVLAEERGSPPRHAYVRVLSATYSFYRGRWDDALSELEAAAALPLELTYREHLGGIASLVALYRDDRAALREYLRGTEALTPAEGEAQVQVEFLLVARALAAEREGDPAEALRQLIAIFDPESTLEFTRLGVLGAIWLGDIVRLASSVGEAAIARAVADVADREATREPRPTSIAVARLCRGLVEGDAEAARDAAERFDQIGYPFFRAQALEDAAVLAAAHGDHPAARSAASTAIDIYTQLDAAWSTVRAEARLRPFNVRRGRGASSRRPRSGWEALTPTEQRVAHLVAEGKSNPDIAALLYLSRHTVESHVSHILSKLNARSRVDIARAVLGAPSP